MSLPKHSIILLITIFVGNLFAMDKSYYIEAASFLAMMQEWAENKLEYGINFYDGQKYLLFSGNKIAISKSSDAPDGFPNIKEDAEYYTLEMNNSEPYQVRKAQCWLRRDYNGNVIESGWIQLTKKQSPPVLIRYPIIALENKINS